MFGPMGANPPSTEWYQRCLRRESWRWGVCCSFSVEIGPSADFLLSSESVLTWQAAASLPLRGRHCSDLRAPFIIHHHQTETSWSVSQRYVSGLGSLDVFIPLHAYPGMSCLHAPWIWYLTCWDWSEQVEAVSFMLCLQWHAVCLTWSMFLPLCGHGVYSAALELPLRSYACPRDRSSTACLHHSVKDSFPLKAQHTALSAMFTVLMSVWLCCTLTLL